MHDFIRFWNNVQEAIDSAVSEVGQSTRQTYFIGKVKDSGDSYTVTVELPGFEREEIELTFAGDYLHVEAKNKERSASKAYLLPSNVNKDGIEAALKNGILTITLKKRETAKRTRIEIR
jgi:HSP20 family protein